MIKVENNINQVMFGKEKMVHGPVKTVKVQFKDIKVKKMPKIGQVMKYHPMKKKNQKMNQKRNQLKNLKMMKLKMKMMVMIMMEIN